MKLEKLTTIKNKILDLLITAESQEKTFGFKGGFWGNFFKYTFRKPYVIKGEECNEDVIFIDKERNFSKFIFVLSFIFIFLIGPLVSILHNMLSVFFVFLVVGIIIQGTYTISFLLNWNKKKNQLIKNKNNLKEVKEKLFVDYSETEIKKMLQRKLTKLELENIFGDIKDIVSKEVFLEKIKDINGGNNDVADPYILLVILNELIEDEIKKENSYINKMKVNSDIIDKLFKEEKVRKI